MRRHKTASLFWGFWGVAGFLLLGQSNQAHATSVTVSSTLTNYTKQTSVVKTWAKADSFPTSDCNAGAPKVSTTGGFIPCSSLSPASGTGNNVAGSNATAQTVFTSGGVAFNAGSVKIGPATKPVGGFAAAAAYSRAGGVMFSNGTLLGRTATVSLGGLTLTGNRDPTETLYHLVVSDLAPTTLNLTLLNENNNGLSLGSVIGDLASVGLSTGTPAHTFFELRINMIGDDIDNANFFSFKLNPDGTTTTDFIDADDFGIGYGGYGGVDFATGAIGPSQFETPETIYEFNCGFNCEHQVLVGPTGTNQTANLSQDELELVSTVPEPSTWLLLGSGLLLLGFKGTKLFQKGAKSSPIT